MTTKFMPPLDLSSAGPAPSTVDMYTSIGRAYEDAFGTVPGQIASIDWALQHLEPHSAVVDLGCGTGKPVCSMLAAAGHAVRGVDLTPAMIEAARVGVPDATFEVGDAREWVPAGGDGSLDGVFAFFSFLAGVTQEEIRAAFPRIAKMLRPGGVFVWGSVPVDKEISHFQWMGRHVVGSSVTAEEMVDGIEKAGFTVEKVEHAMFLPRGEEAGLCTAEESPEEHHVFIYCRKK